MNRGEAVEIFYELLDVLEEFVGGKRLLKDCDGRNMTWPRKGVYFFFEDGETRKNGQPRVVRVGTHALKNRANTTLWGRLRQHRGNVGGRNAGGGNHRGSIFRFHVGTAVLTQKNIKLDTWKSGGTESRIIGEDERAVEKEVSSYIGKMPFLWLDVNDTSGPSSHRGFIERNSIALLSNNNKEEPIDSASEYWFGKCSWKQEIMNSGLWNVNHVSEDYSPRFLEIMESYVAKMVK